MHPMAPLSSMWRSHPSGESARLVCRSVLLVVELSADSVTDISTPRREHLRPSFEPSLPDSFDSSQRASRFQLPAPALFSAPRTEQKITHCPVSHSRFCSCWTDRPSRTRSEWHGWLRKSKAKPNGKKPAAEERKAYLEPEHTKARITDFQFKELVVLPREIDLNEWLASNTTTFFHHINLQYSTISEFCTGETCQTMAVCNTQYYWYDERGKKVKCTAPQYVDFVMSSVQKLVTDEDVFPTKYGREFPSSFESLVRKICRHLFHVLAHIYWAHFKETLALELHGHLNTLYVHFILFAREFNLLDPKETAIMDDLTEVLCSGAGGVHSGGSGDGAGSGGPGAQNHVKER
uniref:MOB kinase activator 2 isoform X2 n=1 Tax=Callithrix jacchus TaxID=9483 RepID=UPI0023DCF8E8|nr:MOB kinase activator 2 isoform X2 [Callithrix jacchus]